MLRIQWTPNLSTAVVDKTSSKPHTDNPNPTSDPRGNFSERRCNEDLAWTINRCIHQSWAMP